MNEQQKQPNEAQGEDEPFDFERALGRIEAIVRTLEEGRGGLDESLSLYEEGVKLLRRCHRLLRKAEQRIELLSGIDDAGEAMTEPFDARETFPSAASSASSISSSSPSAAAPGTGRRGGTHAASAERHGRRDETAHYGGSHTKENDAEEALGRDDASGPASRRRGKRRNDLP